MQLIRNWRLSKLYSIIDINTVNANDTGSLSFFEADIDIPFMIKRIYYIYGVKAECKRGFHAHKKLKQFLFCPYGRIKILLDDGYKKVEIDLNEPSKGLILSGVIWREMIWMVDNSVLCVAASDYYDEKDYIREYNDFKRYLKENQNEC